MPPKAAGVCDQCGGNVVQRVDDREDVIATRLGTYRAQTAPLIELYRRGGLLHSVDARVRADEVEWAVARIVRGLDAGG
jgi:adenylate kinase